jgi:WD40 repeat protein
LASGSGDDTINLWQLSDGQELMSLEGHAATVLSVAFSPDGTKLASGSRDCSVKLWNVADGAEIMSLEGHTEAIWNVRFSPDGALLASGGHGKDNSVRLWDLRSGELVHTFQVPDWPPAKRGIRLAFHPNGKILASGSNAGGTIHLWDLESFREIQTLAGHSQTVLSLHFHPDGKILASGSEDNTIKLWAIENGRELTSLEEHSHDVRSVRFSQDGQTLVSGSFDNTIRFWKVAEQCQFDLDELLNQGCEWLQSYLRHNPHVSDEDRCLCEKSRPGKP